MDLILEEYFSRKNLMVIGLIMVFVLGLYFLGGVGAKNAPSVEKVGEHCESKCSEIKNASGQIQLNQMYSYCKKTFEVDSGMPITGPEIKQAETEFCTDAARCPNLNTCQVGETTLNMEGCIEFMNEYHQTLYNENTEEAEEHTVDLLKNKDIAGTCESEPEWLSEVEE